MLVRVSLIQSGLMRRWPWLVGSYFLHNSTFRRRETFPAVLNSSHACLQRVRLAWRSSSQGMYSSPRSILAHSLEEVIAIVSVSDSEIKLKDLQISEGEMRCVCFFILERRSSCGVHVDPGAF